MMQTMNVDARFQFPSNQAPVDADLAEAVIAFGNALARGSAEDVGGMVDASTRSVLDQLVNSEAWYDATGDIEAVRVVYLGNPSSATTAPAFDLDASVDRALAIEKEMTAKFGDALDGGATDPQAMQLAAGDPEAQAAIAEVMELMGAANRAGELGPFLKRLSEAQGKDVSDDEIDMAVAMLGGVLGGGAPGTAGTGSIDVAFAIQAPGESYVLGWSLANAYDNFVFGMAPVTTEVRRFASDWDGASPWSLAPGSGLSSIMQGSASIQNVSTSTGNDGGTDDNDGNAPGRAPTRKNTPRGPITIPGG